MMYNPLEYVELIHWILLVFCCCIGSFYSCLKLSEPLCVKVINWVIGVIVGVTVSNELMNQYSISIVCLAGLIISGAGSLLYSISLTIIPSAYTQFIKFKISQFTGDTKKKDDV